MTASRLGAPLVRDGADILGDVVPIVIHLMMENAQGVWGMRVIRWWSEKCPAGVLDFPDQLRIAE